MLTIDYKSAREHVLANYPNDPLLRHIVITALEQLPKVDVDENIKDQLDVAVDAINKIAKRGNTWMCPYCMNAERIYSGMCDCKLGFGVCQPPFSKFEWRGAILGDSYFD